MTDKSYPFSDKYWAKINVNVDRKFEEFKDEDLNENIDFTDYLLRRFLVEKSYNLNELGYNSRDDFINNFYNSSEKERKDILLKVFLEYNWANKRKKTRYSVSENEDIKKLLNSEIDEIIEIIETIGEDHILWISDENTEQTFNNNGTPQFTVIKKASVAVVKPIGKNNDIKIKGLKQDEKRINKKLSKSDKVSEIKPAPVEEEIIEKLENLISSDDNIYVKEVFFKNSTMPDKSQIRIKNESSISEDYETIKSKDIIPTDVISEIEYLKVYHNRMQKTFKITMNREDSGFTFNVTSQNASEKEQDKFSSDLSDNFNIKLNNKYEYTSQQERYLFNRLLAGSKDAHIRYISKINDNVEEFVRDVSERIWKFRCSKCDHIRKSQSDDNIDCTKCNNKMVKIDRSLEVNINNSLITKKIKNKLDDLEIVSPKEFKIQSWNVSGRTEDLESNSNKKGIISKFYIEENDVMKSNKDKLYFVPIGNYKRPQKIRTDLLNAIYVKYGNSTSRIFDNYCSINLYDLLFGEFSGDNLGQLVSESISKTRNRTMAEAERMYNESKTYNEELENYLNNSTEEQRQKINNLCPTGRKFEKMVFPLIKDMFIESKKLGGPGVADGLINIPKSDEKSYYVGTYDAKRSHKEEGYNINQSEKDKMSRYIIKDNKIANEIERRTSISSDNRQDAHIIISQNFNNSQFNNISNEVKSWFKYLNTHPSTDIVFIKFSSLLKLYIFYRNNWSKITNSRIKGNFNNYIIEKIRENPNDNYNLFNDKSVDYIIENTMKDIKEYT